MEYKGTSIWFMLIASNIANKLKIGLMQKIWGIDKESNFFSPLSLSRGKDKKSNFRIIIFPVLLLFVTLACYYTECYKSLKAKKKKITWPKRKLYL